MAWLTKKLRNLFRRDDGTQLIEFAIVFPVLLLLFAGTTELGRMFYTYNSLAKQRAAAPDIFLTSRISAGTPVDLCKCLAQPQGRTWYFAAIPAAVVEMDNRR